MENIEKKMEELCIATKSAKQSELQLVSMNEAINFISEKFDKLEKHRREKGKIIKICQKKKKKKKTTTENILKLDFLTEIVCYSLIFFTRILSDEN